MRFVKKQIELAILGTGGMSQRYAALASSRLELNLRIGFSANESRARRWENTGCSHCNHVFIESLKFLTTKK